MKAGSLCSDRAGILLSYFIEGGRIPAFFDGRKMFLESQVKICAF